MFTQSTYALVTCLISICSAIRVDFNTNKGPIVPPTPRTTVRPLLPYREPAPVWEDQSNDIPNPNPYTYILPPPSRPRTNGNNVGNAGQRPLHYYGNLLLPSNENAFTQQGSTNVGGGSLAAKYITNVGIRYTAVVAPTYNGNNNNNNYNNNNNNQANRNNGGGNYFDVNNKLHGKYYNAKTKKYKAYEKVKYVPQNYYPLSALALPIEKPYTNAFNQEQLIRTQQLPQIVAPNAFRPVEKAASEMEAQLHSAASTRQNTVSAATTTPIAVNTVATKAKWAHEKDQALLKGKSLLESSKAQAQLPITSTTATTANTMGGQQANAISSAKSR